MAGFVEAIEHAVTRQQGAAEQSVITRPLPPRRVSKYPAESNEPTQGRRQVTGDLNYDSYQYRTLIDARTHTMTNIQPL